MSIKTILSDGAGTNGSASVVSQEDTPAGLMVYTKEYDQIIGQIKIALNSTYGADMNKNVAFSGTPDGVHNGADSVLWTASALSGTWTFNSTAQAFSGTRSVDATATVNNDEAQFQRGSTINLSSYVAFTGAIYISSWASANKNVQIRFRNAGVDVGTSINLSTYINTAVIGSWQTFAIPVSAFGVTTGTVNQVVVRTISTGGGAPPDYYLDVLQFEEQGSATYTIEPDANSIYQVSSLRVTMIDGYDSTLASNSVPKITYNTLLGVSSLTNGISIRLTTDGVVRFSGIFKQHSDFMSLPRMTMQSSGDGTNTMVNYDMELYPPFIMDARTNDKFEVTLSDNLSGLLYFRIYSRGGKIEL